MSLLARNARLLFDFSDRLSYDCIAMRILITGSRYRPAIDVYKVLDRYKGSVNEIIVGDATGADEAARTWAVSNGVDLTVHRADWSAHGRAAGPMRNQEMVDSGADLCLAFPMSGSRGTWDCVDRARKAGIVVTVIDKSEGEGQETEQQRLSDDDTVRVLPSDGALLSATLDSVLARYAEAMDGLSDK